MKVIIEAKPDELAEFIKKVASAGTETTYKRLIPQIQVDLATGGMNVTN